jgi:hypothetical protein
MEHIRGLVVAQGGRCAITGLPLDPREVNADHIVPLSRKELLPSKGPENVWLVHKKINAMKGGLTYDELVELAIFIVEHQKVSQDLLSLIQKNQVPKIPKDTFDNWVAQHCDESGKIIG